MRPGASRLMTRSSAGRSTGSSTARSASVIALWFVPESRAPISLLELGLSARSGKVVVGCPDGFWRKGNVEVVCERFGIPLLADFNSFVAAVRARIPPGR